jgi:hypothetical protein
VAVATCSVRGYLISRAYQLLTSQQSVTLGAADDFIWHKQVPLKVSIFPWRLVRDKLHTKVNLVSRGIITPKDHLCVAESAQHLFLSCKFFDYLWKSVRSWIGFSSVDSHTLFDHFVQFTLLSKWFVHVDLFSKLFCSYVCELCGMTQSATL